MAQMLQIMSYTMSNTIHIFNPALSTVSRPSAVHAVLLAGGELLVASTAKEGQLSGG